MKRRALVLTDEAARHPFLRSLPPHVRSGAAPLRARPQGWREDLRQFFTTYCAGFAAVVTFFS